MPGRVQLIGWFLLAGTVAAQTRSIQPPRGFPPVPEPEDNHTTTEKIQLGQRMFFDKQLSSDRTVSCATCHVPEKAFTDGLAASRGVRGLVGNRNAPSLFNSAYLPLLLWDGRSPSLEQQAQYPLMHPLEMNMSDKLAVRALAADGTYGPAFRRAFDTEEITWPKILAALACFERTLLSGDSAFDEYFFGGNTSAISASAARGWDLFRGRAGCVRCHQFDKDHPFFSDFDFHNTGVGFDLDVPDLGRYFITRERFDKGRFKTPSLRNVALTAPYMHDGRFTNLDQVLSYYEHGAFANPFLDPRIQPVAFSAADRADLIEFLKSLTGRTAASWGQTDRQRSIQ